MANTNTQSPKTVRAKVQVSSVIPIAYGLGAHVHMFAVYSNDPTSENKRFWDATPQASFDMIITNPEALNLFTQGEEYYVDFIPVRAGDLGATGT